MMFSANSFAVLALIALALLASTTNAQSVRPVVNLGTAGDFAILTKTGVTTTGVTSITGDMGTSPIAATALTGFALTLHSTTTYATSSLVTGQVFAASYTSPTPIKMTTAVSDMETAYTDAAGRITPDFTDLIANGKAESIEGLTLTPGLYKWNGNVDFTSSLVFDGSSSDVWILQIAGDFKAGMGAQITLQGGASAANIFFQIAGAANIGTTAHLEGIYLVKTAMAFSTGSSLNGKALSQTAVTLDATTIVTV